MRSPKIAPKFPKIESPFERSENSSGEYTVNDEWSCDPEWFKNDTVAVEKIDGTNCAVYIEDGKPQAGFTRMGNKKMNWVHPYPEKTEHQWINRAIQNTLDREWFNDLNEDRFHYGEVVGPKIQENPYELDEYLFVPFTWAVNNLQYKSWGEYGQSFEDLSDWFENGLFSLFYMKVHGVGIEEASVENGTFCEGVMFTDEEAKRGVKPDEQKNAENYAKLRRDMFDWYKGERH